MSTTIDPTVIAKALADLAVLVGDLDELPGIPASFKTALGELDVFLKFLGEL